VLRRTEREGKARIDQIRRRKLDRFHRSLKGGQGWAKPGWNAAVEERNGLLLCVDRKDEPTSPEKFERVRSGTEPDLYRGAASP
jgi:hypothetical protein